MSAPDVPPRDAAAVPPCRLIAITDDLRDGREGLVARAAAAVRGGATMIQLRLKHIDPRTMTDIARVLVAEVAVPVIINDRADIALACGAAGVHVGPDDVPAAALRRIAPPGFLIGVSVGSDADVAMAAGGDYVGIGPVYGTASKLDAGDAIGLLGLAHLASAAALPAVAIGGVTVATAADVIAAGASGIAVIAAIFGASDPESAARALRRAMDRGVPASPARRPGP